MTLISVFAGIATLLVLAIMIVIGGGVVPHKHQTWSTILMVAIGIPIFLILMSGFVGIFLG